MRIALTYNLRTEETEEQSERYRQDEVDKIQKTLKSLGHEITPVEVSRTPDEVIRDLLEARPDLVFNVAEGTGDQGVAREAYYPAIFEQLGLPYTGGGPSLLYVCLDKRLSEKLLAVRGINVPKGAILTPENPEIPENIPVPLFVKPNYEGTSKGIYQDSVFEDRSEAQQRADDLLEKYPDGVDIEQFIPGRELSIPFLESWPGQLLEIVEHDFSEAKGDHAIYDYELKQTDEGVKIVCPPQMEPEERAAVLDQCTRILEVMPCPDLGRIDLRLHENGTPYFLEINPLPRLMPDGSLYIAGKENAMSYEDILDAIIRSAAQRYGIPLSVREPAFFPSNQSRHTCREAGITIGRFQPGQWNAITDVDNVLVGHVTQIKDDLADPSDGSQKTCVRTGITAICPESTDLFNDHLVAGGFVLNGIGEMSGLTLAMEWGWMETPILLTNTLALGPVHQGIIQHMIDQHPELGRKVDVTIPLVAETNDAFLNDVRISTNSPEDAMRAIRKATSGPVEQGSVGGGTGMITFDFAGGIGTSSRKLPKENGGYTIGVLVQSNFGKMRNLTVDGSVVGRKLDKMYPNEIRQGPEQYGSIIVIVATDAPLLSSQLSRLSKRAALGLGRVGSFAASTSGEICFAFSTANRTSREAKEQAEKLQLDFLTDPHINPLYEATVECTEEAVLNAIFCSAGQTGRLGRIAPAAPTDIILQLVRGKTTGLRSRKS